MKVLVVDRGLIDGANMARLKTSHHIDTVVPLRKNMNAYQDMMGLTRLKDFVWEPYQAPCAQPAQQPDRPKPPNIVKREGKRQQTLAAKKGLPPPWLSQPAAPPPPRTFLGMARGVTSWTDCTVPLTAVVSREIDPEGNTQHWVLVTTSASFSSPHIRSTYALRTAIEERHRQYKCFWDLARMPSRRFSMVVTQVLFVLLAYTLLQAHLFLRHRQQMNPRTRGRLLELFNPTVELVAVYYEQRFCLLSLAEFAVLLLEVEETARANLLPKMKQLRCDIYHLLQNARPP